MLWFAMHRRRSALLVMGAWLLLLWLSVIAGRVAAAPRQPDASPPTWTVECVDCPRFFDNMTPRSLRLDSANRPHLAYGGDALYHAFDAGAGWAIETVDAAPGVGEYASLAIYSDTLAIAYYDKPNADLKVARRENGVWQVETVDAVGSIGTHTATAFDALGILHVAYFDATNLDLKHASWNGAAWAIETVESQQAAGTFVSLAIDRNNRPHISYIQYVSGAPTPYVVRYAAFDGAIWQFDSAEAGAVSLLYTSLALDANDRPVIAYQNAQNGVLHVTSRDAGGAWNDVAVTPAGDINNGAWPSLAIDASGQLHVAYQGASSARYAYTDPALGWQLGMIDVSPNSGAFSSLALDSNGDPHITYGYNSAYYGDLRYARKVSGVWQVQTLDHREDAGSRASLTIDGCGQAHIAYKVDYTGRSLRYTTFQTPTGWLSTTVDLRLAGFAGDYVSARTDAAHQPRIGYYGGTYGGLRYSELTGTTWVSVTIAGDLQTNMTGRNTSLALAHDGAPHLGYAGVTTLSQIGYAKRVAGAWQTQNVEGFGGCGYTALALTGADQPRLAYCFGNTVRYAAWNGAAWVKSSVVTTTLPPAHIDLVLDSADTPHISYQDAGATNLHYATLQGGAWLTETVDPAANTGLYSAITVNLSGTVYISYYDPGAQNLNVAWRTAGGWITQTVASGIGVLTAKTTLAAAPTGAIGIAFYDAWRHDLKLAASGVFTTGGGGGGGEGGGVVTDCTNAADFLAKVSGGGRVIFACDGVLVIPAVTITATTVISAAGHDVTLSGGGANRLLAVQPGAALALHNLKLTDGVAADAGGAIRIAAGAAVTLTQSTLYSNTAPAGGALANDGGWLYVENSTISGNRATGTHATQGGGAIVQTQSDALTPTTTIRYSTFHSNTVTAGNPAAGGLYPQAGTVSVEATILDDPTPCARSDANPDAMHSAGYNLENADTCGLRQRSDLTNTLPLLGALGFGQDAVNGPRVLVHTPPFDSPAVDSIPAAQCTLAFDQQDVVRPQDGEGVPPAACDRGAVERLDGEVVQTTPYTVNQDGDGDDGRCTIGHCTLREALVSANATVTTGAQAIHFNFGDAAPHAIVVTASLPALRTPLTIDGLSTPGASCETWPPTLQVVLAGAGAGAGVDGLRLSTSDSSVRGLVINGFSGAGVQIDGDRNRVECTFVGTNATGAAAVANGVGVQVRGGVSNTIGGVTASTRNLIAGNVGTGIHIAPDPTGADSHYNHVQGNFIGVQADGVTPLGNGQDGVTLDATGGVNATLATTPTVASNLIGGEDDASGNRIAFNGGNGVTVRGGSDNRITANVIYSNTLAGIALADGGNDLQPTPVISAAVNPSATATTLVTVTLSAAPETLYRLELFASPVCDASGAGEGTQRIDAFDVTTASSGASTLLRTLPQLPVGVAVTATATRLTAPGADGQRYGNTSAFSACRLVVAAEQPPTPSPAAQFLPLILR